MNKIAYDNYDNYENEYNEDDIENMFKLHYKINEIFENDNINVIDYNFPEENDNGFIEYKRNLSSYEKKISKLKTQIYWRISEGLNYNSSNFCYYIIGIENDGQIIHPLTVNDINLSLDIINKCINKSNINYIYKKVLCSGKILLIVKFWKKNTLDNEDIKIILLGSSETFKTNFFIDLHNHKFNIDKNIYEYNKFNKKIFKSDIFDIHSNETKNNKTMIPHHQYFNVKFKKELSEINVNDDKFIQNDVIINDDEGVNIHIIDTCGNSIISNIKYLVSYNVDLIVHFNQNNNLYNDILENINLKYNNVIKITDTSYLSDFNAKKLLCNILLKYETRKKILNDIDNILLINENRLINSFQNSLYNKYIFYCYNMMNLHIFDNIYDINIRNIQYKYNYKSDVLSNNAISIETDKPIHKNILGNTCILQNLDIPNWHFENNNVITFYLIILNQIYMINSKNIPDKIIFDKIILIPEKFVNIPIFVIWCKNDKYFLKIFDYYK